MKFLSLYIIFLPPKDDYDYNVGQLLNMSGSCDLTRTINKVSDPRYIAGDDLEIDSETK